MNWKLLLTIGATLVLPLTSCSYGRSVPDSEIVAFLNSELEHIQQLRDLMLDHPEIVSAGMSSIRTIQGGQVTEVRSTDNYVFDDPVHHRIGQFQKELGIRGGVYHCPNDPQSLFLFIDCRTERDGLTPNSWCKGIFYSQSPPKPILQSLDSPPSQTNEMNRAFHEISEGWYIIWEDWTDPRARCGGPNSA